MELFSLRKLNTKFYVSYLNYMPFTTKFYDRLHYAAQCEQF